MSDEMQTFSGNVNLVITAILAVWGVLMRVMLGRHFDSIDRVNQRLHGLLQ